MATTPAVTPGASAPVNHFGRIIGVFFSPKATLEDIARQPTWVIPVVLMTVLGIAVAFVMNQKIDWRDVANKRIEESPRAANLSADQKEQQIAMSAKISPPLTYVFGTIGPILGVVIVAGVMLLAYNLLGGANANFGAAMGIVSHAFLVTILSTLFLILILYLKAPGTVDIENPVATNVGAFLPESTPKALQSLGKSLDIFSFWIMALISVGFSAVNPKKLAGKSFAIVLSVWAIYTACKMGLAWIFS